MCSYRTMRMILAVCAHEDLEMRQFDIRTAFLNGELEEEVYIQTPAGAKRLASHRRVLRLLRALYGLKQASRAWNKRLEAELLAKGFKQSDADPSLWILHGEGGAVLAMFYVDDGLVAARTAAEADALVEMVAGMFAIRALGEPEDFLGIEITRDRQARTITIGQERKAVSLAAAAGVIGEQRKVPMSPDTYAGLRAAQPGELMAEVLQYQSLVGSLLHLAQCTRPDIAVSSRGACQLQLSAHAGAPRCAARRREVRGQHCDARDHLRAHQQACGDLVRRQLRCLPGHAPEHHGLGGGHVRGSGLLVEQEAAHHSSLDDGRRVPGVWARWRARGSRCGRRWMSWRCLSDDFPIAGAAADIL